MARMKKKGALSRRRTATTRAATVARRKGVVVVDRAGARGGVGGGEDRISDLPDDLLRLVLRRLDTRTALSTGALSRRWASLCRGLDFLVSDVLPPRYHRCRDHLLLHHPHATKGIDADGVKVVAGRHERLAMRKMAASIDNFLDAAPDEDDPDRRRRIARLRMEFIVNHHSDSINRLIATAIDAWGVKDLEVLAAPPAHQRLPLDRLHIFPHQGICSDPRSSTLTSLTLANYAIPPLQGFQALTILVFQHLPISTRPADCESVFTSVYI
uniref:F-box domain-containing protein n=1 Tax=Oryza meridionalis TaxID=40149 RepID=A0A0E0DUA7_9ORYZ